MLQRWLVQLNDCVRYHYRMSMWQKHCVMVHLESMKNVVEQMQQCIQVWGRLVQICKIKKCDDSTLHFVCWIVGFFNAESKTAVRSPQQLEVAEQGNAVLSEHAMLHQTAAVAPNPQLRVLTDYQAPWPRIQDGACARHFKRVFHHLSPFLLLVFIYDRPG